MCIHPDEECRTPCLSCIARIACTILLLPKITVRKYTEKQTRKSIQDPSKRCTTAKARGYLQTPRSDAYKGLRERPTSSYLPTIAFREVVYPETHSGIRQTSLDTAYPMISEWDASHKSLRLWENAAEERFRNDPV